MNVLIIDDIRLARKELRRLLNKFTKLKIVGEAANAEEARKLIRSKNPDLLFLDIKMPGENGFELLESLPTVPKVIFTTAFDEFAVQAFEKNDLDYLMKPIEHNRLKKAINKAKKVFDLQKEESDQKTTLGLQDTVFVKDGEECKFITLKDIRYFETMGNYAKIHFKPERILIKKRLSALDQSLSSPFFFRANLQVIVNIKHIE